MALVIAANDKVVCPGKVGVSTSAVTLRCAPEWEDKIWLEFVDNQMYGNASPKHIWNTSFNNQIRIWYIVHHTQISALRQYGNIGSYYYILSKID